MSPLDFESWLLDEQARSLLEHHFGWYEPTWDDLQEEHWAREDRLQDFSGVVAGLTNPAPRTGTRMTTPSVGGRAGFHHSSAGSPALSSRRVPAEQTFSQGD